MESSQNQNLEPLATLNDQTRGLNEWFPITSNPTFGGASNYGSHPYLFGGSSFNWNGTISYPMAYGGHVSYCNTQQQQQPEFGYYCSIPSPAPSTSVSPTKQVESVNCSRNEYTVSTPFHSPPLEQIATFYSTPLELRHFVTENQNVSPSYGSNDEKTLQTVVGNPETVIDLSLQGQANPTTVSGILHEWRCEQCNKQFVSKAGRKHHIKVLHTDERLFRCEKCGKRFTGLMQLQRHISRHVTNNKPYECDHCPKTFNYRADLRRHQYRHSGDAPHQCSICEKSFVRRDHMRSHELTHLKRLASK
uniref:C2H2-type domain-containing protein n=1 Tax=Anopheles maculatus TaxID=74869 RepID=A0A182SRS7_9DIPT